VTPSQYSRLVARAWFELLRYDVLYAIGGFACLRRQLARTPPPTAADTEKCEQMCRAVVLATCLYWKPVLCLQRSVCTVRVLRAHGVLARLVIGYRPLPFLSHAWVEGEDRRVLNESPAYARHLRVVYTA
jgi:hypothetical protein